MDADAILAAIRAVLLGTQGSVRTVPTGTFVEGVPAEFDEDHAKAHASVATPSFDVEIAPAQLMVDTGPANATPVMLRVPITVTLTYHLAPEAAMATTERRRVRALAVGNANTATQALQWNRNVEEDPDSNATGIIPGGLRPTGEPRIKREEWTEGDMGILELELPFEALVLETRAVS